MNKTVGATTKRNTNTESAKILTFRNRLNGEIVHARASSKTKIIDGVEFLEVLVHGRTNLMRKEHLQPISG
jgi:transcriptional antiterminator Rof (Rho-off)